MRRASWWVGWRGPGDLNQELTIESIQPSNEPLSTPPTFQTNFPVVSQIQHANSTKDGSDIIAAQRYARAHNLIGALRDEYEAGKETSFAVGNVAGKEWIAEDPRVETGDGVVGTAFTMRTGPDA